MAGMSLRKVALQRLPALLLMGALQAVAVVIPILDQGMISAEPVVGTERSGPSLPGSTHNHQLCVQYGANPLAVAEVPSPLAPAEIHFSFVGWSASAVHLPPDEPLHFTRAPPLG